MWELGSIDLVDEGDSGGKGRAREELTNRLMVGFPYILVLDSLHLLR